MNNTNAKYALGIQTNVAVTTSGNMTTQTGSFSAGNAQVVIPADTIVTVGGNTWNGTINIPTYTTTY